MFFLTTLSNVAVMILYCVPGFLVVKTRLVKPEAISAFAIILMYVCQPALTLASFAKVEFSPAIAIKALIFTGMVLILLSVFLVIFYQIYKKRFADEKYRVYVIATTFSNCTFMGLPLLESLFPDNPEVVIYSLAFFLGMSLLCWTVGSYIISGDKKYISAKKLFINPAMISLYVAIPLWVIGFQFPEMLKNFLSLLGKMTTPMCMLVLGMRLATVNLAGVFTVPRQYLVILVNQILMPVAVFLVLYFIPMDTIMKDSLIILAATPVASVVLNFAEMIGKGQKTAANCVLLGTILSLGTIPLISLLLGLL